MEANKASTESTESAGSAVKEEREAREELIKNYGDILVYWNRVLYQWNPIVL